jgi:hypothetical protein
MQVLHIISPILSNKLHIWVNKFKTNYCKTIFQEKMIMTDRKHTTLFMTFGKYVYQTVLTLKNKHYEK